MRLPTIAPDQLTTEQRPSLDTLHAGIEQYLQSYVIHKADGTLIGRHNAPKLGRGF